MTKIDLRPFIDTVSVNTNQQVHINHAGCPAGTDTRKRLYIKRVGLSAYVGYCHNCGLSGYYFSNKPQRVEDLEGIRNPVRGLASITTMTHIAPTLTKELPLHVKAYLLKYQVTPEEAVNLLEYQYCTTADSLVMPFYQSRHATNPPYQMRHMGEDRVNRYSTYAPPDHPKFSLFSDGRIRDQSMVIVEDQISGYRIMRDSGGKCAAIALMGTHSSTEFVECLRARNHTRAVIWMDDDAAGKKGAMELHKELAPLLPNTRVGLLNTKQPKDYSVIQARDICKELEP